jgi:hypothetical protein
MPTLDRINAFFDRWRSLVYAGTLLGLLGFGVITPNRRLAALESKTTAAEAETRSLKRYVRALAVAECLDRPLRETQLMGLNCQQLQAGESLDAAVTTPPTQP